ncbi:uncharacterized protein LOC111902187 [Lactuca sativa]|uniref:uncharacterized protein LOC111902187 n=1 Tax=Lactuca sativa TaxID=4236 RepID=UPI000CD8E156|nr:uncharacterized protein LOC111902187 [Lactuca sativa]
MVKWWWRLRVDKSALWCQVINGIHNLKKQAADQISKRNICGVCNNIAGASNEIQKVGLEYNIIFKKEIGNGQDTLFWLDVWWGNKTLKSRFPELFNIDCRKSCRVSDRISDDGFAWDWKSDPMAPDLNRNLSHLEASLGQARISNTPDTWSYTIGVNGLYTAEAFRNKLDEFTPILPGPKVEWMKEVPLKVRCFVWRAKWGRIPSAHALEVRGVQTSSTNCGHCMNCVETADHIFTQCELAVTVCNWIMNWCGTNPGDIDSTEKLLLFAANWSQCSMKRKILTMICYGMIWSLWKARNARIFNHEKRSPNQIIDDIQTLVFYWLKHRGSMGSIRWCDWIVSPFSLL